MKILAYIIYYIVMFAVGVVLGSANVRINTWQYWAIIIGYIVVFVCGTVGG